MVSEAIKSASKCFMDAGLSAGKAKVDKGMDFGSVMAKQINSDSDARSANDKVYNQKTDTDDTNRDAGISVKDTNKTDNTNKTVSDKKTDKACEGLEEEVQNVVENVAIEIIGAIKELLGISEEDIENAMELLGLSTVDILKPENVLKVIMQAAGETDPMSVIADSKLGTGLKDILSMLDGKLDELKNNLGISAKELEAVINEASELSKDAGLQENEPVENYTVKDEVFSEAELLETDSLEDVVASKITVDNKTDNAKADTSEGSFGQNTDREMAETRSTKAEEGIQDKSVAQQITQTFETILTSEGQSVRVVDVVKQVVDSIKLTATQTLQSIEVVLNPENLGKVNVQVSLKDGLLTAQITTEDEQVRKALESQMSTLKESFETQGLKVESVEVMVKHNAFDANSQFNGQQSKQDTASKAKRRINLDELLSDENLEDTVQGEQMKVTSDNSSVEFTA